MEQQGTSFLDSNMIKLFFGTLSTNELDTFLRISAHYLWIFHFYLIIKPLISGQFVSGLRLWFIFLVWTENAWNKFCVNNMAHRHSELLKIWKYILEYYWTSNLFFIRET